MKYTVYNQDGEKVSETELNPKVFDIAVKQDVVHQVLVAQEANARQVLAHTKQRAEVRGGGRKPHRQKGTGRARAGSIRSPIWTGGGVTFGPTKFRNFEKKVNKKMKKKALFMMLSDKAADKHIILLDELKVDEIKTKLFVKMMNGLFEKIAGSGSPLDQRSHQPSRLKSGSPPDAALGDIPEPKPDKHSFNFKTLIVSPSTDDKLIRSSNNIQKVKVIRADSLNVRDVLDYEWLVVPVKSLEVIEKTYLKAE